jgi:hypothetical protein
MPHEETDLELGERMRQAITGLAALPDGGVATVMKAATYTYLADRVCGVKGNDLVDQIIDATSTYLATPYMARRVAAALDGMQ